MTAAPDPITLRFRSELGPRLRTLREASGFDLAGWARRLGISRPTAYAWEGGSAEPLLSQARAILQTAEQAGVSATADWLLGLAPTGPAVDETKRRGRVKTS